MQREVPTGLAWRTNFLKPPEGVKDEPMAFLVEGTPARVIRPHFHENDQFQVVMSGGGVLGKHKLQVHAVHFSRAHTPYGPIVFGEQGLSFLTLRARWDPGAQYLPDSREKLVQVPERKPWQMTEAPSFGGSGDVNVHTFEQIKDERGLAAFSLSLKPHATAAAPDPSQSGGQYIIVTRGSLTYQDKEYKAISIAFVKPGEEQWQLAAGAEGLEALVLNYPRREPAIAKTLPAATSPQLRIWQCALCSFMYDESKGMPDEGIAAGTRWEDVPETWSCPDCAASKSDFQMSVVG
jgi:rubredoxin/quercetin dioxygenase-like cupin family protein